MRIVRLTFVNNQVILIIEVIINYKGLLDMSKDSLGNGLALHTDLYQINMMYVYWKDGIADREAVFDAYFRKLPFGNGYAVFAGMDRLVDYVMGLRFEEDDLAYLVDLGIYEDDFIDYLRDFKFEGTIDVMAEGEVVFANEPMARVRGGLAFAQLIETALLNIINYHTLIATKASRIRQVVPGSRLLEFGTRRAQEMDAAIWGTRAAYIGGFDGTSNVKAGKMFGIPVSGTHAHAMVQVYGDEYVAFSKYAETHRDCVFLVDTYDTLKSGVPNAIRVAKEFGDRINFKGIRLDSGDMAYLSNEARKMLDEAGFTDTKIIASNDLDEYTISALLAQGSSIDDYGVGTKLITAYDQPALGAVYKLVALKDEVGEWQYDRIKISSNPEKVTTPGLKDVYRVLDTDTGKYVGDVVALEGENLDKLTEIEIFDPVYTYKKKRVDNAKIIPLLASVISDGKVMFEGDLELAKKHLSLELEKFWPEYKRMTNPEEYMVTLSRECYDNKMKVIEDVLSRVNH